MKIRVCRWAILVAATMATGVAHTEIVNAGPTGFNIRYVVEVPNVPAPTVWAALSDVAKWWDPEHTYSGDAHNLSLDPVVHGCFCEKLSLYSGIEHARVVYALPAKTLRLSGALGPLQEFGVTGSLTWQIEPVGGGSRITMTYSVGGYADRPLAEWAPIVDEVLVSQVKRLGRYVTVGNAEPGKSDTKKP
jgi:hypothetical protein